MDESPLAASLRRCFWLEHSGKATPDSFEVALEKLWRSYDVRPTAARVFDEAFPCEDHSKLTNHS